MVKSLVDLNFGIVRRAGNSRGGDIMRAFCRAKAREAAVLRESAWDMSALNGGVNCYELSVASIFRRAGVGRRIVLSAGEFARATILDERVAHFAFARETLVDVAARRFDRPLLGRESALDGIHTIDQASANCWVVYLVVEDLHDLADVEADFFDAEREGTAGSEMVGLGAFEEPGGGSPMRAGRFAHGLERRHLSRQFGRS